MSRRNFLNSAEEGVSGVRSVATAAQISPFCLRKLIVAKAAAAAPNGGYLRVCVTRLITEGSRMGQRGAQLLSAPQGPASVGCDSRAAARGAGDVPRLPPRPCTGQAEQAKRTPRRTSVRAGPALVTLIA